jgi:hypothetical protein
MWPFIVQSLTKHLHGLVPDVEPTLAEWATGVDWLTRTGQMYSRRRQEFILASAICSESGSMNFCFKWRHRDGSTVEFSPAGWASGDPLKADWLSKMNQLSSSGPAIPPAIRMWLQSEGELINVSGPIVGRCLPDLFDAPSSRQIVPKPPPALLRGGRFIHRGH